MRSISQRPPNRGASEVTATRCGVTAPSLNLTTFSVVARDAATGMFGVAVATAVPAVGAICPFAQASVGAVATQASVNVYLGIDGLRLLEQGLGSEEALARLIEADPARAIRQLSIVDAAGRAASHSGVDCVPWFGHRVGEGVAVAGNMLVGPETVGAMFDAYQSCSGDFIERLVTTLEAGQGAGGDQRGRQSAALKIVSDQEFPYCDLRVDEHSDPIAELRRVVDVARVQLFPFLHSLPTRQDPARETPNGVRELLGRPTSERNAGPPH